MRKLTTRYLCYTFAIMLLCWGTCWVCSACGVYMRDYIFLYPLYLLGGWSPTIASYFVLKQFGYVDSFRHWLRNVFALRNAIRSYGMVLVLAVFFILPQCLICGYEQGAPLMFLPFMIPVMLFCGGLEEAGWRYILQPELEKKFGFLVATLITGMVWWLWHLPLFFIQGVSQYGTDFFAFGINVLGLSFALAAIHKCTGSVWLCVLFHCITNSLHGVYVLKENIWGNIVAMVILVITSWTVVKKKSFSTR